MPDLPDLDSRIRELVARAVSDAPPAPEIGDPTIMSVEPGSTEPPPDRRGWRIGGAAVLLAAAAALVAFVLVNDDPQTVTPATVSTTLPPTVPEVSAPATTVTVTTTASIVSSVPVAPSPGSIPTSVAAPAISIAPTIAPTTIAPTTTPPTTGPAGVTETAIAVAGPDGVSVIENGVTVRELAQPAEIALLTPGGAVIFQAPRSTVEGDPGDPQIWRPDGTVERLLGALAPGQWYRLHDVATIDEIPTVLYGVRTDGPAPENYREVLKALALDPAGWRTTEVGEVNTWEGGYSRLSLSNGGTVIGTVGELVTHTVFWAVVPGSPDIVVPPPVDTGTSYTECDDCPDDFAISADGEHIAWTMGGELVVRDVETGESMSWTVSSLAEEPIRSLDVRARPAGGIEVAISFGDPRQAAVTPPVLVTTQGQDGVVETPLTGRVATFGP